MQTAAAARYMRPPPPPRLLLLVVVGGQLAAGAPSSSCSESLARLCPPRLISPGPKIGCQWSCNQWNCKADCEACLHTHVTALAAAGCTASSEKSFCVAQANDAPPPAVQLRFTCQDGQCVKYSPGKYTEASCNSSCSLLPAAPPYNSSIQWPWFVASSSRLLSYTQPTSVASGGSRRLSEFTPTPVWHAPAWPPPAAAEYKISLALQRGGCQAVQLVLHAPTANLLDISVDLDSATVPGASWQALQQLYVLTKMPNTSVPRLFADPLLPLAPGEPIPLVRAGETQPIVLRLCVGVDSPVGATTGGSVQLRGRVLGGATFHISVPVQATVWSLVLPPTGHDRALSLSANFMDSAVLGLYGGPDAPGPYGNSTRHEWLAFLANYSIPANGNGLNGNLLHLEEYIAHAKAGGRWIVITDVSDMNCAKVPCSSGSPDRCNGYDDQYLDRMVETIRPIVEGMQKAGYGDRLIAYGFDESLTGQFKCDMAPSVRRVFGAVKAAFPNVTTISAGFGYKVWGDPPPMDVPMDVWISDYFTFPWPDVHVGALSKANCQRQQGEVAAWRAQHGYWWYWASAPAPGPDGVPGGPNSHPYWLNPSYIGWPPIGGRLLMWLAVANDVSGMLYYASDNWPNPKIVRRTNGTMITDTGGIASTHDGDGALLYPGENGPIPSLRLLNIAAGIEDAQLFAALSAAERKELVGELVPSGDQWLNDPGRMDAVRLEAARRVLQTHAALDARRSPLASVKWKSDDPAGRARLLPTNTVSGPPLKCDPTAKPAEYCPGGIVCPASGVCPSPAPPPPPPPPTPTPAAANDALLKTLNVAGVGDAVQLDVAMSDARLFAIEWITAIPTSRLFTEQPPLKSDDVTHGSVLPLAAFPGNTKLQQRQRALDLDITAFGGSATHDFNNRDAIDRAVAACQACPGGCRLSFPARMRNTTTLSTVYRTSSFSLSSHMTLFIPAGVTLRGTETDHDNMNDTLWPSLPTLESPAQPCMSCPYRCGGGCGPVKRAWIHAFNLTDVELTGGGALHGGGQYWWCARRYPPQTGAHCAATNLTLHNKCPPRMLHVVESRDVHIHGLTIKFSPFWTLHIQFCDDVLVEDVSVFNPNNATFKANNADGIDISSSRNVHVRRCTLDVGDDAIDVRAGDGWRGESQSTAGEVGGRCSAQNILVEQLEYRNGHGLRVDQSGAGGVRNVTFRDILVNGNGPVQNATLNGRPHVVRFTVRPNRGGIWDEISWGNISGDNANDGISMLQNHNAGGVHGGWPLPLPPQHTANLSSAAPILRNIAVRGMMLTDVGSTPAGGFATLAAAPIENLTLDQIHLSFKKEQGWTCVGLDNTGTERPNRLYVRGGTSRDIQPPLQGEKWNCSFSNGPPPPDPTVIRLTVSSQQLATVRRDFVSMSYDASFIRRREEGQPLFNISSPRLHTLLRELRPCIMRIGGTAGDHWQFEPGRYLPNAAPGDFNVSQKVWDVLIDAFVNKAGMQLVVGLNALTRDEHNAWDPANARALISYNKLRLNASSVIGYELGNEPGLHFHPPFGRNNVNVSDRQLAADYGTLERVLGELYSAESVALRPLVIGPDADLMGDFKSVLAARPTINVSTFHCSPFYDSCTIANLLDPKTANLIRAKFNEFVPAHREYAPWTQLWLGEGSTDESQRKPNNCTGRHFGAGFTYIEMLGISAVAGIDVYMRHSIDSMFFEDDWSPTPVYWVALLWTRLMGSRVLNASTSSPDVLAFAHHGGNDGVTVAVAFVNLRNETVQLGNPLKLQCVSRLEWVFSAMSGLNGSAVALNGATTALTAAADGSLPDLSPRTLPCHRTAALLPRHCYGFLAFKSDDPTLLPRAAGRTAQAVARSHQPTTKKGCVAIVGSKPVADTWKASAGDDVEVELTTYSMMGGMMGGTALSACYAVRVREEYWFVGFQTDLYAGGQWHNSSTKELSLSGTSRSDGADVLGSFASVTLHWKGSDVLFDTSIRVYNTSNSIVFAQAFPLGVSGYLGTASPTFTQKQWGTPGSAWPAFDATGAHGRLGGADGLGFAAWRETAGHPILGRFPTGFSDAKESSPDGIPLAFFDEDGRTAVLSPLTSMLSTVYDVDAGVLRCGVQGTALTLPAGHSTESILVVGRESDGVNEALIAWGDLLRQRYGKPKPSYTHHTQLERLGYSSVGHYFYGIEKNTTAEDTMVAIAEYAKKVGLPYNYFLIDSWWYKEGPTPAGFGGGEDLGYGGTWRWDDTIARTPHMFPSGLRALSDKVGPLVQHMGKWTGTAPDSSRKSSWKQPPPYALTNPGEWIVEPGGSLPTGVAFWDSLWRNASEWGLQTFKLDHVQETIPHMNYTSRDVGAVESWLTIMTESAYRHGIYKEYGGHYRCLTAAIPHGEPLLKL